MAMSMLLPYHERIAGMAGSYKNADNPQSNHGPQERAMPAIMPALRPPDNTVE